MGAMQNGNYGIAGAYQPMKTTKEETKTKTCPHAQCCNKCMCVYICALTVVLLAASIVIFIFVGIPMANIDFDIRDLHIELWDSRE